MIKKNVAGLSHDKVVLSRKIIKGGNSDFLWGMVFLLPIFTGMLLFVAVPIVLAASYSTQYYDLMAGKQFWNSFENFSTLFDFSNVMSTPFWDSLKNIVIFAPITTILSIGIGLVLADMLNHTTQKVSTVFKIVFYIPIICSVVATTSIWGWMYNSNGPLVKILESFGVYNFAFDSPNHLMGSMILMSVWGGFGGSMLLYFAALKNVPKALYEAASIDGARPFKVFFKITFPMVTPTTFFLLLTGLIGNLQAYSQFMTYDPNGAFTPVVFIYKLATGQYGFSYYGYACAVGLFYGLLVGIVALINFIASKYWVNYDV